MDDLKNVFDKIEKAESILNSLEEKRTEKVIEKDDYDQLSQEHRGTVDSARRTIASIKERFGKDLSGKTAELDKYQEDLAILQTRLKVGEISDDTYNDKSKHLVDKIRSLEKKVAETQNLINAKFAEDIVPVLKSEGVASVIEAPAQERNIAAPAGGDIAEPDSAVKQEAEVEPPATLVIGNAEAAKDTQPEDVDNEEITRQRLIEALKIEPEETAQAKTEEMVQLNKQEEKAGEKVEAEAKSANSEKGHKPSLHLHPLRGKPPDIPGTSMRDHHGKNRFIAIIVAVLILGLLVWGAIALFFPKSGPNVGDVAPNFVMQVADDNTSALSSFRGRTVVLIFWDRDFWDGQFFYVNGVLRRLYTPDKVNQLYNKYAHSDLEIIAIASGTSNNEIDKLIHDYNVQFPVIVDSFGKLKESYKIGYEPTYMFLDKDGVIRARVEGPITNMADLEQMVYNTSKNAAVKTAKPPITDIIVQGITEKSAVINWTTDKPTNTQVDIDGKNIQSVIAAPQTLHSMTLRDLDPATAYHIRIIYNVDNINVSEHSFSALGDTIVSKRYLVNTSNKDTIPPEISNISTGFVTDSSITIIWKTDEPATGEVGYSVDRKYADSVSQVEKPSIWHTVKIDDLKPDTQYYLRLSSKDGSGKVTSQEIEPITTQNLVEIAPKIGKRAPDFTLYSIDGTKFTLSQFLGRKILLNFWLEGCPACEAEMPLLQTEYSKYSRDQLVLLAVNVRGEPDKVSYYVAKEKLTFPVLMDRQGDADGLYRAPFFPTTYFIDTKGIIREIVGERFQTASQIDDILKSME